MMFLFLYAVNVKEYSKLLNDQDQDELADWSFAK
jgi:hypothetical protein